MLSAAKHLGDYAMCMGVTEMLRCAQHDMSEKPALFKQNPCWINFLFVRST